MVKCFSISDGASGASIREDLASDCGIRTSRVEDSTNTDIMDIDGEEEEGKEEEEEVTRLAAFSFVGFWI